MSFLLTASFVVSADPINERQLNFKLSKKSMKTLRESIKTKNLSDAFQALDFHIIWSAKLLSYFPPESEASMANDSDASADIWEDFERFRRMNLVYINTTSAVNSALLHGDFELASKGFFSMAKACKGCHENFRN